MAKPLLNHAFTTREKGLILALAIVALIAVYFFLVVENVANATAAGQEKSLELAQQIDEQQKVAASRLRMQNEIEALGDVETLPYVASYDNIRSEFDMLNSIFQDSDSYTLTFMDPQLSGTTVRRQAKISFDASSYSEAEALIRQLEAGTYRCQVNDVTMTGKVMASGSIDKVSVNLTMVFFETTDGSSNLSGLQTTSK